jgi:pSer/pThr/pTyr-binding forkhead associated (FHA) protein
MLRLIATYDHTERVFTLPEGEARLGSAPENDMVLSVPGVSRRHALVRSIPGGVEIVDLGSKNGLLVEGERVARTVLTPGLRVQIGAVWLGIEEISGSGEVLALLLEESSEEMVRPSPRTATLGARRAVARGTPAEAALVLAFHIAQFGARLPGTRDDLLLRVKATLHADALASF